MPLSVLRKRLERRASRKIPVINLSRCDDKKEVSAGEFVAVK